MKPSSAKAKGRNLQQRVCRGIAELLHLPFDQQDDQCLIHSREMGQSGIDIILRGVAQKQFPFSIECKNTETFSVYKAIEQAKSNQSKNTEWAVVHKKNHSEPIVIMDWAAFLKLMQR